MTKKLPRWITQLVIAILIVVLCILAFQLYRQYRIVQRSQLISAERLELSNLRKRGPLTIKETSLIQSWMTFDYISTVYNVPVTYLKTSLNISDPRYPHISINKYVKTNGGNVTTFVADVVSKVSSYIASSTSTTTVK